MSCHNFSKAVSSADAAVRWYSLWADKLQPRQISSNRRGWSSRQVHQERNCLLARRGSTGLQSKYFSSSCRLLPASPLSRVAENHRQSIREAGSAGSCRLPGGRSLPAVRIANSRGLAAAPDAPARFGRADFGRKDSECRSAWRARRPH